MSPSRQSLSEQSGSLSTKPRRRRTGHVVQVMKDKAEHGGLTANMFWVKPEDKVFEAIKKMAEANVGSVLVLKSGKFRKVRPVLAPACS